MIEALRSLRNRIMPMTLPAVFGSKSRFQTVDRAIDSLDFEYTPILKDISSDYRVIQSVQTVQDAWEFGVGKRVRRYKLDINA